MKAIFIGTNSLGYVNGFVYEIETVVSRDYIWIKEKAGRGRKCAYKNVEAFLSNWNVLKG